MSDDSNDEKINDAQPARYWVDCFDCGGEGVAAHGCHEDTCCCDTPDGDMCYRCGGDGGWFRTTPPNELSDEELEALADMDRGCGAWSSW